MTSPSTTAFDNLMSAHTPRMVPVPWERVFTPEELATMPLMNGPTDCWPGTDIFLCSRPQKFKRIEDVRKLFLCGKDHSGKYDVCIMRWEFKEAFPSPAQVALGADPNVPWGYFVWYAMIMKSRIQELTMQVGLA